MKKRYVSLLLVTAMLSSLLCGCGTGTSVNSAGDDTAAAAAAEDTSSADSAKTSGEPVTLSMWDNWVDGTMGEAMSTISENYQKENTDVTIDRVAKEQTSLEETLKAAFMAGDAPDIVYLEAGIGSVGNYVKAGYYADLTEAYEEYGWKDTLASSCWEIPSADGYIWGVGNEMETMSLYINQDIFDELGLSYPETIEELTEEFETIKKAGYTPLANIFDSRWYDNMNPIGTILYAFMSQEEIADVRDNDGSWDKESVRNAIKCIQNWIDSGYLPDHPEVDGDMEQIFAAGDVACWITGNWEVGYLTTNVDFNVTVVPFPGSVTCPDGGSQVNFAGGAFLVNSSCENKEAAYQFIDYCVNNPETATIWSEVGGTMPPYQGEYEADLTELGNMVAEYLSDSRLQNTAGINMWLGSNAFEFFSTCGQNMVIGTLDEDAFIAQADEARDKDVASGLTKGSFTLGK